MTIHATRREEMLLTYGEEGPSGGERLVEYNVFLTDAFGAGPVTARFFETREIPDTIDGFENDDSYRRSRHLIRTRPTKLEAVNDHLRENSLARQLEDKTEQPATIRLIRRLRPGDMEGQDPTQGGRRLPWVNLIPPNTKFFLERVVENREEKVQVVDTFGEWIAFFYGRRPEVYSYAGTLLNAKNHDWKNEFQENYEHFLRGSQAVKHRATMFLQYDDVLVEGYLLSCQLSEEASLDKAVPFSFNLLVLSRSPLNPRNLLALRLARSTFTEAEESLFRTMQEALDLTDEEGKPSAERRDNLETFLLMREFFAGNYVPPAGVATSFPDTNTIQGPNVQPGPASGESGSIFHSQPFRGTYLGRFDDPNELSRLLGRDVGSDALGLLPGRVRVL